MNSDYYIPMYNNINNVYILLILIVLTLSVVSVNLVFLIKFNNLILSYKDDITPYINKTESIIKIVCKELSC
jgi:hypothetical protein